MTYFEGDVLVPREGSSFCLTYREVKLVKRNELREKSVWWTEATSKTGGVSMTTFFEDSFTSWKRKPTFFRMGYTYIYKTEQSLTTNPAQHTVEDIYSVEKPESPHDKVTAILRVRNADGTEYITLGTQSDFDRMVEKS